MAEEHLELIHQEIDGVNSDAESARLREHFKKEPEAEQLHADLSQLNDVLARVEDVAPPEGLRRELLESVTARRRDGVATFRQPPHRGSLVLRYGYFLAAGLLLGVGIHAWWVGRDVAPRLPGVSGTMAPPATLVEEVRIGADAVQGFIRVLPWESGYQVELQLDATRPVEVALGYEPGSLGLAGFTRAGGEFLPLAANEGRVEWTHDGANGYTLQLLAKNTEGSSLTVEFSEAGQRIAGEVLRLPAAGRQ
jgi:hypothetical protein